MNEYKKLYIHDRIRDPYVSLDNMLKETGRIFLGCMSPQNEPSSHGDASLLHMVASEFLASRIWFGYPGLDEPRSSSLLHALARWRYGSISLLWASRPSVDESYGQRPYVR